jgi:hypothetical protein
MLVRSARTLAMTLTFALVAVLGAADRPAHAKDAEPKAAPAKAAPAPSSEVKKAPPRPRATNDSDLYACHPKQDLACTIVHETANGVVVVTFRPSGAKNARVWSVVNAGAAPAADAAGGTIYIVPKDEPARSDNGLPIQLSSNDSPILD